MNQIIHLLKAILTPKAAVPSRTEVIERMKKLGIGIRKEAV